MSIHVTLATSVRILRQLRRDPRTVAMVLVVPSVLVGLLKYLFAESPQVFDRLGGPMLGLFPFILMFLLTSITMLRERTSGTLERLMAMPLAKLDLLLGYGIAFGVLAALQAVVVSGLAFGVLGLDTAGSAWPVVGLAVANALLGMSLGLLVSAFAATEFQAVQFMPAFVMPQLLLCGLFVPREEMARALELTSMALPLTYAFDALQRVTTGASFDGEVAVDLAVTGGVTVLALILAAGTLRRQTA